MANGKNMDLFADKFVNDAVGLYNQLPKPFKIRGYGVETFGWNIGARERKAFKHVDGLAQFCLPTKAIIGIELCRYAENNVLEK